MRDGLLLLNMYITTLKFIPVPQSEKVCGVYELF